MSLACIARPIRQQLIQTLRRPGNNSSFSGLSPRFHRPILPLAHQSTSTGQAHSKKPTPERKTKEKQKTKPKESKKKKKPDSSQRMVTKADGSRRRIPHYHQTPSVLEESGEIQWPAPSSQIAAVRAIIKRCAASNERTLLVPDKDADGLSAGALLRHTLIALGLSPDKIDVHFITKGRSVHDEEERRLMEKYEPRFVFVLDQGTRSAPPIVETEGCECVVIDHHHVYESDVGGGFPKDCTFITASTSPPVATTSLLTYHLCAGLDPEIKHEHAWLCCVGAIGDLGTSISFQNPFPDMTDVFTQHTKKAINDAVSLINAPRRTAEYDVASAWNALAIVDGASPTTILKTPRLRQAREEVNAEVERCTHAPPKFSADGRVAVLRISSAAQVHPVIATRWAGHLKSKALCMVMVANEGYLPGKVNFSCRIARCAKEREGEGEVDLIKLLREYAALSLPSSDATSSPSVDEEAKLKTEETTHEVPKKRTKDEADEAEGIKAESTPKATLLERIGENFARGHVQASGGIVTKADFEELMQLMRVGEKKAATSDGPSPAKKAKKSVNIDPQQKNTLIRYFGKKDNVTNVAS